MTRQHGSGALTYVVVALGLTLSVVATLVLRMALRELDVYVSRFGWGYAAVPLSLILPAVAAATGVLLAWAALRRWDKSWQFGLVAIWLVCAIAVILLPLRD